MFRDICTDTLTNWQAVHTLRATNIQLLIDAQPDPYDALRKQRAATKNKYIINLNLKLITNTF